MVLVLLSRMPGFSLPKVYQLIPDAVREGKKCHPFDRLAGERIGFLVLRVVRSIVDW